MIGFLANKKTYPVLGILGYGLLALYLIIDRDFSFSIAWSFGYLAILYLVIIPAIAIFKLETRFPKLNRYHFARKTPDAEKPQTHDEWKKKYAEWKQ